MGLTASQPARCHHPANRGTAPEDHDAASLQWNGPNETYLIKVQLAASLNAWSSEETGVQVTLALEGKVLQVLVDLQTAEQTSWPAIERAVQRWFG